jgi:Flp pilus assembly protein TadG
MKTIRIQRTRLAADERGMATVEFGLIGSVFCVLLLGAFDLSHTVYVRSIAEGAMQGAARSSALQSGSEAARQAAVDLKVKTQILELNKSAQVTFSRRFYKSFTKALNKKHEMDINNGNAAKNNDGKCEAGETFADTNNNYQYDLDGGDAGQGGAQDIVVYTSTITYPRMFPVSGLIGWDRNVTVKATTVLQNQPYDAQSQYGAATVRPCP